MSTNPYFTQYHTTRFSFVGSPQQHNGVTLNDQRFLNCYPELIPSPISEGKKYYLKKRPGLGPFNIPVQQGAGRGMFFWNGHYYSVCGVNLYIDGAFLATLSTSVGSVGFTVYQFTDHTQVLIVADGGTVYQISTSNTVTTLVGAPSPHVPTPIFFDGYLFLAQANSSTIWNCKLNDPTTWPADQFIDAEMYPYNIVSILKNKNYIVAISVGSIEFFYDNANPTGSPLQRNAPAVAQFGTPAPKSVTSTDSVFILVGSTNEGGRTVWTVDGFQPTEIGIEPIREALDHEGTNISGAIAYTIQCSGHKWYILNLFSSNRTFVYDLDEKMWHEWSSGLTQQVFSASYASDSNLGKVIVQDATTGILYELSPDFYDDNGAAINMSITTSKVDFDTIKRKRIFRLSIIGDTPNGNTNVPMSVYFSDDGYTTFVGPRTLYLNGDYSTITNLGLTRRRAWRFVFQQPYPLRLESFELDLIQEVRR